jgi:hypothetical protein
MLESVLVILQGQSPHDFASDEAEVLLQVTTC